MSNRAGCALSPYLMSERRLIMMKIRLAIAVLVAAGLVGAPMAAQAKKVKHVRHYVSDVQPYGHANGAVSTAGVSVPVNGPHGASGTSVGTVTAPSVGTYNWPSVGVTNAVPTWSNTNPK
jgi:hypothetical protein